MTTTMLTRPASIVFPGLLVAAACRAPAAGHVVTLELTGLQGGPLAFRGRFGKHDR